MSSIAKCNTDRGRGDFDYGFPNDYEEQIDRSKEQKTNESNINSPEKKTENTK